MPRLPEMLYTGGEMGPGLPLIRFALRPPPRQFRATQFAMRICQHLLVYTAILISAVYACALVFLPAETFAISIVCIAIVSLVILLSPHSRKKMLRLLEGGLAASYIAGAAALLKAFEAFLHRM
jgi:hypothetical protein